MPCKLEQNRKKSDSLRKVCEAADISTKDRGGVKCEADLEHALGKVAVVLLGDLGAIGGPLEHRRVVVHVLYVNHHRRVVLLQIVRCGQLQLVLSPTKRFNGDNIYTYFYKSIAVKTFYIFTHICESWIKGPQ